MELLFTANCGVILKSDTGTIAIDALHSKRAEPFSTVPEETLRYVHENVKIDALLYTHAHPDHYGEEVNRSYIERYHPILIMQKHDADIPLVHPHGKFELKKLGLKVEYMRLLHSGEQYQNVVNYGFILTFGGKTFLSLGDASLSAPETADFIAGRQVDYAFINFPFYTLSSGRETIKNIIKPKEVIIQHLPFSNDDRFSYQSAIEKRSTAPGMPPLRAMLTETLQRVEL